MNDPLQTLLVAASNALEVKSGRVIVRDEKVLRERGIDALVSLAVFGDDARKAGARADLADREGRGGAPLAPFRRMDDGARRRLGDGRAGPVPSGAAQTPRERCRPGAGCDCDR